MKIIDTKKDYYDYLSGIYGEDSLAVYDRRGSVAWKNYQDKFSIFVDPTRIKEDEFIPPKYFRWRAGANNFFLCLEAGKKQFIIKEIRELRKSDAGQVTIQKSLFGIREVEHKHAEAPLALFECDYGQLWRDREVFFPEKVRYWAEMTKYRRHALKEEPLVENPILIDSFIPQLIPAEDIWHALYEYIMSLNDKEIKDTRPDALKLESAGFDKKTSFRNVK